MKTVALFLFLFIMTSSLLAQEKAPPQYGMTANLGIGKLRSPILKANFDSEFSANFGLRGQWNIKGNAYLGAEFLWLQFSTNYSNATNLSDSNTSTTGKIQYTFFSLPVYFKKQIDKLGLKFGLQAAVFAFGRSDLTITQSDGGVSETFSRKGPLTDFNNPLNYGPKFGIDYQLNDRLNLRGDVFYDLSNEISNDLIVGMQQFTIGLDFNFSFNKEEE